MLHIFIVSLHTDVEKRENISKVLNSFNLNFTFIDAVYGKALPVSQINTYRSKSAGKLLSRGVPATPGEIGCTLSHIEAYKEVLRQRLEWACILEDDVILDSRFKSFINNFQKNNLDPDDLYLLGGQNGLSHSAIIKNIKTIGKQHFHKTLKSSLYINRTCCYLINANLAKKLVDLSESSLILADDWHYLMGKNIFNNIYLADFVDHPIDLSQSSIQKERDEAFSHLTSTIKSLSIKERIRRSARWRLRILTLKLYRYVEFKDNK